MAIKDWFKKAKEAKNEAKKPKKEFGFMGSQFKDYDEAQAELKKEEGTNVALDE